MNRIHSGILLFLAVSQFRASDLARLPSIGIPSLNWITSWYGKAHEGRPTASGTVFHREELTAAHRTAKFGTRYLVFYRGQAVEVVINDRGPYVKRQGRYCRDLDLSEAAARSLGLTEAGVARVSLRPIEDLLDREVDTERLLPMSPTAAFD